MKIILINFIVYQIVFSISSGSVLKAQSDFQKGYVITNKRDTIVGLIDFRSFSRNSYLCSFKKDDKDSITAFAANDILGYRLWDDKYYISRSVPTNDGNKTLFLEFIIKGQANIYYYRDIYGEHYLIDKQGGPLKEISYHEDKIIEDHVAYLRESTIHIGLLKAYLNDCPVLFPEIEKLKKPNRGNLVKLVKDYHYQICNNNDCIIYEKRKPKLRIDLEAKIALSRFHYASQTNIDKGFLLHFWLPLSSEKLFIRTGFMISKPGFIYNDLNKPYSINKFPLAFEYIMPGKLLKPKFSYGINFYSIPIEGEYHTPVLGAGFLLYAFKHVYFSAEINAESTPILSTIVVFHEKPVWLSYSFDFGLLYRF